MFGESIQFEQHVHFHITRRSCLDKKFHETRASVFYHVHSHSNIHTESVLLARL